MDKKANTTVIIGVLATILVIAIAYFVGVSMRECSTDNNCPETDYCGSDFKCHEHKQITVENNYFIVPAFIIAIAIIVAALITKKYPGYHG